MRGHFTLPIRTIDGGGCINTNGLEGAIVSIAKAVMHASRSFGESIPEEGITRIQFDDSIIQDTAAEKAQDMAEMGVTMNAWEYRMKWYGEDEETAKERVGDFKKAEKSEQGS